VLHPIQNIGAYGVELSDVFYDAVCINRKTGESRIFNAEDCDFGYRDSAFKNDLKDSLRSYRSKVGFD
jgi:UDP-N-acetylmuramate dehydrogenase